MLFATFLRRSFLSKADGEERLAAEGVDHNNRLVRQATAISGVLG